MSTPVPDPNGPASFTVVMQSGDRYVSEVVTEEVFERDNSGEMAAIMRRMMRRFVEDPEESLTHISHARVFLEEQEQLHPKRKAGRKFRTDKNG